MKTSLTCILIFIWLLEAHAELIFRQRTESQSLELSCSPQQGGDTLTGLHLYHRTVQSQKTLLSMAEGKLRVPPELRERLQLHGGLDSLQVNVTISHLQPSDTGLYMWEISYREHNFSDRIVLSSQKVFLLVEGTGRSCHCSPSYLPLLLTIFTAAGLLLFTLSWLALEKCVKAKHHHTAQPPVAIYEEMTWKQQSAGTPQNNHEATSHLEEVSFPVYANPNIRQPQDNYYACPRQLALKARRDF